MVTVPELEPGCGSWIVVDVLAQKPLAECYLRATVDRLAELAVPGRVEILTALQWLRRLNQLTAAAAIRI